MDNIVLLIVDVQQALIEGKPYNIEEVIVNIQALIAKARDKHVEVVYVRHDGGEEDDLEKGTPGFEIYHEVAPIEGEQIFDKVFNSAFKETGLHKYLQCKNIKTIVLCGLQTEYCVDTTCKAAFELGYEIIIPQKVTSTFDNESMTGYEISKYFEEKIWSSRFAEVLPLEKVIKQFDKIQLQKVPFKMSDSKIETERLTMRRFLDTDGNDLYEYLSDPKVVEFEPYGVYSREEAEKEARNRSEKDCFFAVCSKDEQSKVIGNIYLAESDFDTWEIGYVFNSHFQGKGYAYEAACEMITIAFKEWGARRIVADCNPLNRKSRRLLERLGMRREGTRKENVYFKLDKDGKPLWSDTYEYGILKSEWEVLHPERF